MRVVVNQMVALGRKTGIGHYTGQLLRGLRIQAPNDQIDGFPSGTVRRAFRAASRVGPLVSGSRISPERTGRQHQSFLFQIRSRGLAQLRQVNRAVLSGYFRWFRARGNYDLYHEPNGIPLATDCPTLVTLHDLSVLLYPQWHPADRVAYYERHFRNSLEQCVHFLAVSEFTRQEVIRHLGIPPERVTRTYNGIRANLSPLPPATVEPILRQLGLPRRYLLYLGTIEPRKNILMLLRAYCSLPEPLRAGWPLVLVGAWGWNASEVAEYLHGEARHRGVLHLGYLKDKHLAAVYSGARALVYPSWYEGFGLPPLEMLACGGAVLASTAGAVAETVGRRAHLIEPGDFDGWRDALARVLVDDDWWQSLRAGAVAAARPFTWERCAAETLRVYRAVSTGTFDDLAADSIPIPARRAAG